MTRILSLLLLMTAVLSTAAVAQESESKAVKPVLLVIDVQNRYIPMMDTSQQDTAVRTINGAIWLFRQHELPIIRVYHTDPQWGPPPESEDFQFPETINIQETDPKIVKTHPSAFVDTDLDKVLKEMGANTLFLCGLSATGCVLATYFGGLERSYDVFLIEDSLMSPKARHTEAIQEILHSVDFTALRTLLRAAAP